MMSERDAIDVSDLPDYMQRCTFREHQEDEVRMSMRAMELRHLQHVLDDVGGDRERAAEVLQIGRTTLYRLLKRTSA